MPNISSPHFVNPGFNIIDNILTGLPALPQLGNLLYQYDLTDLTTMYTDNPPTVNVANDGDAVVTITDIQGNGNNLVALAMAQEPAWVAADSAVRFDGDDVLTSNASQPDGLGAAGSWALLGFERKVWPNAATIAFMWQFFSEFALRIDDDASSNTLLDGYVLSSNPNSASPDWDSLDVQYSAIAAGFNLGGGSGRQRFETSDGQTVLTTTEFQGLSGVMRIGAINNTGSSAINAYVRELLAWDVELTASEMTQVKAYDTAKHGTMWA